MTDATPDASVELTWAERGGPAVRRKETDGAPKARRGKPAGFGTVLIDRVITHDLDGKADINFDPTGVRCTLIFPVRGQATPHGSATV